MGNMDALRPYTIDVEGFCIMAAPYHMEDDRRPLKKYHLFALLCIGKEGALACEE